MPKNDDGEFELILKNSQLLSVFFIVVILLSVFFSFGYIAGRNSGTPANEMAALANADAKAATVETPGKRRESTPPGSPPETTPRQPALTPGETEHAPLKVNPDETAGARFEPARSAANGRPEAGQTYLQLAATSQHEANIMVDVLRKNSFRAMAWEIDEKPGTFRVLVGPVTDTTANRMRADLQGAGFPGNAAIRRTF